MSALCGSVLVLGAGLTGATASPLDPGALQSEADAKFRPAVAAELDAQGDATVLVRFEERPDLSAFAEITSWEERGEAVYDALVGTAERSQADARAALDEAGVPYESFAVSNAILVPEGDRDLLSAIAEDPEVEGLYLPASYEVPAVTDAVEADFAPAAVEWGVADINADDVWAEYGVDGSGIVVGSIDTGVKYDHPALVDQYRGNNGDGTFTHDYSWLDTTELTKDAAPTDHDGHGTHTTGTMVGSDGVEQIGVAPGARWIAANACCQNPADLIEAGEWMLAPTDAAGDNPDPALRPHIVNNSWGSSRPSNDPFMVDVSEAWEAAGMFAVWANGNSGPRCTTSSRPGSLAANYSVGAYSSSHAVSPLSGRGVGEGGVIKPDIAAPGTAVRSAALNDGYVLKNGTSMATAHVSGAVALLWSAVPALVGDTVATRQLLDGSAIDTPHDQCGGPAGNNNVFGEGRLDALALIQAAAVEPEPPTQVARLEGANRYETAARIAEDFAQGVSTVVIASGGGYPDALAGAARVGSLGGPLLLVRPDSLPDAARTQLQRLQPDSVIIAGGPSVVSEGVEAEVRAALPQATVVRRAGSNRYGTAALLAADVPTADRVFVASGENFPDAVAGAARAAVEDAPLLLVRRGVVPDVTAEQLARLAPREIVVLGGETVVSEQVATELGTYGTVVRRSGSDRFGTAASIAERWNASADVYVATGADWPDALAGAARAGATDSPVLLVQTNSVPLVNWTALDHLDPDRVLVLGGGNVVSPLVMTVLGTLR